MAGGAGIDRQGVMNYLDGKVATGDDESDVVKSFEVFDREGNGALQLLYASFLLFFLLFLLLLLFLLFLLLFFFCSYRLVFCCFC
jgi:hypothetical protein